MSNEQINLSAALRPELGKGPTGRLRREGRTPGIIYGNEVEPTALSVDSRELYHVTHTSAGRNALIRLEVDGDTHLAVIRDPQKHPLHEHITHVDFLAVNKNQLIAVEIPIHLVGADDVQEAGIVNQVLSTLPIKAKPLEIPDSLDLDIAGMQIGDVRRAEDVTLPDGTELDIDPERTLVTINAPQAEEVEEVDESLLMEGDAPADEAPAEDAAAE